MKNTSIPAGTRPSLPALPPPLSHLSHPHRLHRPHRSRRLRHHRPARRQPRQLGHRQPNSVAAWHRLLRHRKPDHLRPGHRHAPADRSDHRRDPRFLAKSSHQTVRRHLLSLIGSSWSLAVEFSFYVIAPFLVCRTARVQIIILALCFWSVKSCIGHSPQRRLSLDLLPLPAQPLFLHGRLARLRHLQKPPRHVENPRHLKAMDHRALRHPRPRLLPRSLYPPDVPSLDAARFHHDPLLFAVTSRSRLDRLIASSPIPATSSIPTS